jgi:hypothetical protein
LKRNFHVKGLAKFGTQNQQNAINLLLLLNEQNWAGLQQQNGRTEQENHWRELIRSIPRRRTNPFLPLSLLASPLLSSTRWQLLQRRGGAGSIHVKGAQLSSNPSEHPRVQNIRTILDSSDLRIMHVSSQTVAFRRDLRIRGLRSTIGATDQKVKFWSTLKPL